MVNDGKLINVYFYAYTKNIYREKTQL